MLRALGWGLNQSARIFYIRAFSGCHAILKSYNNSETAVYGCNPVLFWVLWVSCCCLAGSVFTYDDQHCSVLLAEFKMSILRIPVGRQAGSKSGRQPEQLNGQTPILIRHFCQNVDFDPKLRPYVIIPLSKLPNHITHVSPQFLQVGSTTLCPPVHHTVPT